MIDPSRVHFNAGVIHGMAYAFERLEQAASTATYAFGEAPSVMSIAPAVDLGAAMRDIDRQHMTEAELSRLNHLRTMAAQGLPANERDEWRELIMREHGSWWVD